MNDRDRDLDVGIDFTVRANDQCSTAGINSARQVAVNSHHRLKIGLARDDCPAANEAAQIAFLDFARE